MKHRAYTTFAAIHLGSEMVSMQIFEYHSIDRYKIIESCDHRITLGEETFKNKTVSFSLVNEICDILLGFKNLMREYGVEEYKLQATTAMREAKNQVFLLDQIYSKTGLKVDVVDMPREIYTKYVAIRNTLKEAKITSDREGLLMMDISSGGLGITFVQDEQIKYQENFHIGIIRIKESFERNKRESLNFNRALTEFLASTMGPVRQALKHESVRYLVLSGTETELILKMMGLTTKEKVYRIKTERFRDFFYDMRQLNLPQLIKVYDIPENVAELVLPTVLLYEQLLNLVTAQEIIITSDRFIDGMQLLHIATKTKDSICQFWEQELISLFHCIGKRYSYDEQHVRQVERLALLMFDKLAKNYGMGEKERLLLRGAAILHDIGKYICMRSHSAYSYQLLMDTDIIGFSDRDKKIMALVAYYHANRIFDDGQTTVKPMSKDLIPVVAKLAAILRMADAMDRSYLQKVKTCVVTLKDGQMLVSATSKQDLTLEEWTFASKSNLFEEVYGLKAVLERVEGR